MDNKSFENDIIGAFYLHTDGSIIFKPLIVFATDPQYFKSSFVKHVWLVLKKPPDPTKKGQIRWLLKDLFQVAYNEGALESEILKWVTLFYESEEFNETLREFSPEQIAKHITENTLEEFLKGL